MMGRNSALCAAGGDGDDDGAGASADDTDIIEELMEKYGPAGGQLSFGWFCGLVSGYALKRIGQKVAFGLGVVFLVAQGLAYSGFIDIKWNKVLCQPNPSPNPKPNPSPNPKPSPNPFPSTIPES
mmetsp:Transcript_20887/g.63674  ORF Transcript_20887/g.63674 Transcript_20887/m.63674 type:complete len:125 (-) Transcript_20887:8-382(-)